MLYTSILINFSICILLLNFQLKEQKSVIYLCLILIIFNLRQISGLLLTFQNHDRFFANLIYFVDPIDYLIGPLTLYYFKSLIRGKLVFNYYLLLYCLPALLLFINVFPIYQLSTEERITFFNALKQNLNITKSTTSYFQFLSLKVQFLLVEVSNVLFVLFSFRYYWRAKKQNRINSKNRRFIISNIFIFAISILFGIGLVSFTALKFSSNINIAFQLANKSRSEYYYLYTLITPLSFFFFPKIIYGLHAKSSIYNVFQGFIQKTFKEPEFSIKESTGQLSDRDRIVEYIEINKPFLKPDYSLYNLSKDLNIPHLRVSICFNQDLNITYPEYKRRKRVEYAIELFKAGNHKIMSIEGIATQCGFKNKSSFYLAFQREFNLTPKEWIEKHCKD